MYVIVIYIELVYSIQMRVHVCVCVQDRDE